MGFRCPGAEFKRPDYARVEAAGRMLEGVLEQFHLIVRFRRAVA
jgi:hypothetical protein